jgi:hypothetical protein
MSTEETVILHEFFQAQWKYPTKNDWTEQTKTDLDDLEILVDLVKSKSKFSFSQLVQRKSKEFAFQKCMEKKESHSKVRALLYSELKIQEYLGGNQLTATQA